MTRTDKLLGALSLCRKAGKLKIGFDGVCESAAKGEAKLVLYASDLSPGTRKKVEAACDAGCERSEIVFSQQQLAIVAGKPVGVLGVVDEGLATLCRKAIEEMASMEEAKREDLLEGHPQSGKTKEK